MRRVFLALAVGATVSCAHGHVQPRSAACPPGKPVPGRPPNVYPRALVDSLGLVELWPNGERIVRSLVMVAFDPTVPLAKRREAIDRVCGVVIGGSEQTWTEGYYFIQLPGQGTAAEVQRAVGRLMSLPQVKAAMPLGPAPAGSPG
jgi:hypothetical protein